MDKLYILAILVLLQGIGCINTADLPGGHQEQVWHCLSVPVTCTILYTGPAVIIQQLNYNWTTPLRSKHRVCEVMPVKAKKGLLVSSAGVQQSSGPAMLVRIW